MEALNKFDDGVETVARIDHKEAEKYVRGMNHLCTNEKDFE